ncbi:MAG: glycoside hydrolase family 15 protein [Candidatus Acidiferrales bacterium]
MSSKNVNGQVAPGHPGITPHWTSSSKSGVGTAVSSQSRLWFTISHGIINEIYYPNIDRADTRDFQLLVTDGLNFFSEEKRDAEHKIEPLAQGVPGYRLTNTCKRHRYRIVKTVVIDSLREVLLQRIKFEPLLGSLKDYHLYALLAPHVNDQGQGNNGWLGDYKSIPMLFAQREDIVLALACSAPFLGRSCGYVGRSDGWSDISEHKRMTWFYPRAMDGNLALTAEIDLQACGGDFCLALGFGEAPPEAGQRSRATLLEKSDSVVKRYVDGWQHVQTSFLDLGEGQQNGFDTYRVSTAVLRTHESKRFPGGMIASLSIPWGASKSDHDVAGYHVVWPRDLVQAAGGLLAAGDPDSARRTLFYLMSTQDADGHWPQNMWLPGTPYWNGIQMDGTGFVILLADLLRRTGELSTINPWPTVRAAAAFLVGHGPESEQDRWEENAGYSTYTMAVEIAALLAAADFADEAKEGKLAGYLRQTADTWNSNIDQWTYATGTQLARKVGVDGYYVRMAPPEVLKTGSVLGVSLKIKNQPADKGTLAASAVVSPDALALVRYGLRAANDPRIVNTAKVIDATLKTEVSTGPVWHRYTMDGYGETSDGSPFGNAGIGRGWPLLGGERAHYELARGNRGEAHRLLGVMAKQTSPGGLIPEQVWDAADIPQRELFNGHPSGSGMPLAWAHAEYVKLARSLRDERVFDTPPQTVERYQVQKTGSSLSTWRFNHMAKHLLEGTSLRVEVLTPAIVHWSGDDWKTVADVKTVDSGLGLHYVDLPTNKLPIGGKVTFTFFWPDANRWEGANLEVGVAAKPAVAKNAAVKRA